MSEKSCKTVDINGETYVRADLAHGQNSCEDALLKNKDVGLKCLIENRVLLMCCNYFYEGYLVHVDETDAILTDAAIVYETGPWTEKKWKDRQSLPGPVGVKIHAIESYQQAPNLVI